MKKTEELMKNTAVLSIGVLFARAMTFLLLPYYTIYLSPTDYGAIDLIVTYVTYLAPFIIVQSDWSVFKFLIDARGDEKKIKQITSTAAHMIFLIACLSAATLFVINIFVNIPHLLYIILLLLSSIISAVMLQYARGLSKNTHYAVSSIVTGVASVITFFAFVAFFGLGIEGVLLSSALSQLVGALYIFVALKLYKFISLSNVNGTLRKKMLQYSWPLAPEGISWWIMNASDRTIISIVIGVAANGIYAVANKYAMIITIFFGIFNLSWSQSISAHIDDKDSFVSDVSNTSLKIFSSIGLMMIVALPFVFSIIINNNYKEAYLYIPILVLANVFYSVAGVYSGIYIAKNLTKQIAKTTIAASVINIIVNLSLISHIGVYAAAISTLVAYLLLAIYRHYDVKKYLSIIYDKKALAAIAILYSFAMVMYYKNDLITNVLSFIIVLIAVIIINRSTIAALKVGISAKLKPLSPFQTAVEDIENSTQEF